ncbi:MAG: sterol desaturase family protein [Spongiibacteraceae bacterium]
MRPELLILVCIFAAFAIAEALRTGLFRKPEQRRKDVIVETISSLFLLIVTQPTVLLCSGLLMAYWFPGAENSLAGKPLLLQIALLLIFDDMMQYWWHRLSHTAPWLYKLHRPHHDAPYMSIRIVYRNNIFYYALMPSLWFSGALIYMGLGTVYAVYLVIKLTIIYGAHSDVRWDAPLYRIPALSPLMWLVERTISTPATHSAHHGRHAADGITNYAGNYGNMLFFWDVLFGTAKITRRYPPAYGVENLHEASVGEQLLWPIYPSGEKEYVSQNSIRES